MAVDFVGIATEARLARNESRDAIDQMRKNPKMPAHAVESRASRLPSRNRGVILLEALAECEEAQALLLKIVAAKYPGAVT